MLLHLLLVPGTAFLTGGARIWEQNLHPHPTQLNHTLLSIGYVRPVYTLLRLVLNCGSQRFVASHSLRVLCGSRSRRKHSEPRQRHNSARILADESRTCDHPFVHVCMDNSIHCRGHLTVLFYAVIVTLPRGSSCTTLLGREMGSGHHPTLLRRSTTMRSTLRKQIRR